MIRNLANGRLLCAVLVVLSGADAALAGTTYTISGDFGSSVFQYGTGNGGSSFTQQTGHSACYPQLDCYVVAGQPVVAKNVSATDGFFGGSDHLPAGTVQFHPITGFGNTDAIIRFVAPVSAAWHVSGSFWRNDVTSAGNGTRLSTFTNIGGVSSLQSTYTVAPNSYGSTSSFAPFSVNLAAGDSIDFALNNIGGDHRFDSTGIDAQFTANVPEPASWAMLIAGFGIVGAAARRQRAVRFVPA